VALPSLRLADRFRGNQLRKVQILLLVVANESMCIFYPKTSALRSL